jgi:hypothetical protein
MRTKALLALLVLAVGSCALHSVARATPTKDQRDSIQDQINKGNPLRDAFEKEDAEFWKAYHKWEADKTEENRQAARDELAQSDSAAAPLKANRDSIIAKVDSTFDTNEPPGTSVTYDPDLRAYGRTSSDCTITLGEESFSSPDEVASAKIHEFEHQRQKQAGKWGPGNVPKKCTYLFHDLEFDAYEAELNADFGSRTSLSLDSKTMLLDRKISHLKAMIDAVSAQFEGSKIDRSLRDRVVEKPVTIGNDANYARTITGHFEDGEGWVLSPPSFIVNLGPGRDTTFMLMVHVPAYAPLGIGNEIMCTASAEGDTARTLFFVNVIPPVDVAAGSNVSGLPLHDVMFSFTVVNETTDPGMFDVTFASTLGWSVNPLHQVIALGPNESLVVPGTVTIPVAEAFTTDLIAARAFHSMYPSMPDSGWLYAMVEGAVAGVEDGAVRVFALLPNAPNPFSASTLVRFSLSSKSPADLKVFDVRGRLVRTLVSADGVPLDPGMHVLAWDGRDNSGARVASGVYFARLVSAGRSATMKMTLLR